MVEKARSITERGRGGMKTELTSLLEKYEQRILGQSTNLRLLIICDFSRRACIAEGVPGTGKTQMVKTLAQSSRRKF